jgi:cytochrome c5
MNDQHESPIKTPKQLIITIVLSFAIPIAIAAMASQFVTGGKKGLPPQERTAQLIQPVARLQLASTATSAAAAPAAASPAAATPVAAAPAAGKADGKGIYEKSCAACHGTGVAGAPKLGDKAAWAPRLGGGADALAASAIKGKNAMPPKGGNAALSDADVKAAVDYLIAQAR